jgi:predicted metal-dependent hydrolase
MEYKVIYSDRKTISITVKDEKVIVKSPFGATKSQIDDIVTSHIGWIEKHIKIQSERKNQQGELTEEKIKILRKRAKEILPIKTEYYSNIMGLKYGRITITGAKTRFGSCSSRGNISFSYLLMQYPDEAIDYVVVHELAHLKEMNHSQNFYKIVESVLPDYKERRKLLKK